MVLYAARGCDIRRPRGIAHGLSRRASFSFAGPRSQRRSVRVGFRHSGQGCWTVSVCCPKWATSGKPPSDRA